MSSRSAQEERHHVWVWGFLPEELASITGSNIGSSKDIDRRNPHLSPDSIKEDILQFPDGSYQQSVSKCVGSVPGVIHYSPMLVKTKESSTIRSLTAGYRHVAITTHSGKLYSWGSGVATFRETGCAIDNDSTTAKESVQGDFWPVQGMDDPVLSVACSRNDQYAVTATGKLLHWKLQSDSTIDTMEDDLDDEEGEEGGLFSPFDDNDEEVYPGLRSLAGTNASEQTKSSDPDNAGKGGDTPGFGAMASNLVDLPQPSNAVSIDGGESPQFKGVTKGNSHHHGQSDSKKVVKSTSKSNPEAIEDGTEDDYFTSHQRTSQLGLHSRVTRKVGQRKKNAFPELFASLANHKVTRIASGSGFSVAVTAQGTAFTWGRRSHGRLGHGTDPTGPGSASTQLVPRPLEGLDGRAVATVACGWNHSVLLLENGQVYTFGCGGAGRLGHGTTRDQSIPTLLPAFSDVPIVHVACGYHHTIVADVSGAVYGWGGGEMGQLGVGNRKPALTPVQIHFPQPNVQQRAKFMVRKLLHRPTEVLDQKGLLEEVTEGLAARNPAHRDFSAELELAQTIRGRAAAKAQRDQARAELKAQMKKSKLRKKRFRPPTIQTSIIADPAHPEGLNKTNFAEMDDDEDDDDDDDDDEEEEDDEDDEDEDDEDEGDIGYQDGLTNSAPFGGDADFDFDNSEVALLSKVASSNILGPAPTILDGPEAASMLAEAQSEMENPADMEPVMIIGLAAGPFHSAAVSANGEVYTWGWGRYGQLGIGPTFHPLGHLASIEPAQTSTQAVAPITKNAPSPSVASQLTNPFGTPSPGVSPTQSNSASKSNIGQGVDLIPSPTNFQSPGSPTQSQNGPYVQAPYVNPALAEVCATLAGGTLGDPSEVNRILPFAQAADCSLYPQIVIGLLGLDAVTVACGGTYTIAFTDRVTDPVTQHEGKRRRIAYDLDPSVRIQMFTKQKMPEKVLLDSESISGESILSDKQKTLTSEAVCIAELSKNSSQEVLSPLIESTTPIIEIEDVEKIMHSMGGGGRKRSVAVMTSSTPSEKQSIAKMESLSEASKPNASLQGITLKLPKSLSKLSMRIDPSVARGSLAALVAAALTQSSPVATTHLNERLQQPGPAAASAATASMTEAVEITKGFTSQQPDLPPLPLLTSQLLAFRNSDEFLEQFNGEAEIGDEVKPKIKEETPIGEVSPQKEASPIKEIFLPGSLALAEIEVTPNEISEYGISDGGRGVLTSTPSFMHLSPKEHTEGALRYRVRVSKFPYSKLHSKQKNTNVVYYDAKSRTPLARVVRLKKALPLGCPVQLCSRRNKSQSSPLRPKLNYACPHPGGRLALLLAVNGSKSHRLAGGLEASATGAMGSAAMAATADAAATAAAMGLGLGLGAQTGGINQSGFASQGISGQLSSGAGLSTLSAGHARELHMMNARYRAKLLRDARERASLKRHDLEQLRTNELERRTRERREAEREGRLHDVERVWQTAILPKWPIDSPVPISLSSKAAQLALTLGVPPRLRGAIWPLAVGNPLGITPSVFATITARATKARARYAEIKEVLADQPGLVQSTTFYLKHGLPDEENEGPTLEEDYEGKDEDKPESGDHVVKRLLLDQGNERAARLGIDAPGSSPIEALSETNESSSTEIQQGIPTVEETAEGDYEVVDGSSDEVRFSWSRPRREFDKSSTFRDVDVDLTRTFPHLAFFQDGCPMKLQMRAVLDAYCFFRPDIGYVQGMSYLAGKLLLYMSEYEAFVCLANMMETSYFRSMFLMNELSDARYEFFCDYFKEHLPDLYEHFESTDILSYGKSLYFVEWSMTLFCKRLELDVVGRIWDCYFMMGEQIVYRAAVAVLSILKPLLMTEPFEVCHRILTKPAYQVPEDKLMASLATIKWKPVHERRLQDLISKSI